MSEAAEVSAGLVSLSLGEAQQQSEHPPSLPGGARTGDASQLDIKVLLSELVDWTTPSWTWSAATSARSAPPTSTRA